MRRRIMDLNQSEVDCLPVFKKKAVSANVWVYRINKIREKTNRVIIGSATIHKGLSDGSYENAYPELQVDRDSKHEFRFWRDVSVQSVEPLVDKGLKDDIFKLKISIHNLQQKVKKLDEYSSNALKFGRMQEENLRITDSEVLANQRRLTKICEILQIPYPTSRDLKDEYESEIDTDYELYNEK